MDYKARFYSPSLGRFTQPDTIIPSAANPQSWNRFSYVGNKPIRYNDPTGHYEACNVNDGDVCQHDYPDLSDDGPINDPNDPTDDDPEEITLEEELEVETSLTYTDEFLDFCVHHPYDSGCTSLLPPETCTPTPMYQTPGSSFNPPGCRYAGVRSYFDWNRVDKADLFFNGLGLAGAFVLLIGVIGVVGLGPALIFYEATQLAGFAYDVYKLDYPAITWDVVSQVAGETKLLGKAVPGFGALINYANVIDALKAGEVIEHVYEPYPRPLVLP